MKLLLVAASVLALSGTAAFAEGNGEPFPFSGGQPMAYVPMTPAQQTGQTPKLTSMPPNSVSYGRRTMASTLRDYAAVPITSGNVLPTYGSQGGVQTANSLPPNAEVGTVPYEQAQSVQRYLAQHSPSRAVRAYVQAPHANPGGG
jgi:hypothetical protein